MCHTVSRFDPQREDGDAMTLRTTSSIAAILESWRQHGQSLQFAPVTIDPFALESARDVFYVRALTVAEKKRQIMLCPHHGLDETRVWFGAVASDNQTIQAAADNLDTLLADLAENGYDVHEPY